MFSRKRSPGQAGGTWVGRDERMPFSYGRAALYAFRRSSVPSWMRVPFFFSEQMHEPFNRQGHLFGNWKLTAGAVGFLLVCNAAALYL